MPEYIIKRLNDIWAAKGSAQSVSFLFAATDPDTKDKYLITFEAELLG